MIYNKGLGVDMSAARTGYEPEREQLSQTIVNSLKSWPEIQRRIFIEIRYAGRSIEEISRSLGLTQKEVFQILQLCEHKLFHALKAFRSNGSPKALAKPPGSLEYSIHGCCH
jgi:DNA-directed RNA polymerase specialized sigma24 family protein